MTGWTTAIEPMEIPRGPVKDLVLALMLMGDPEPRTTFRVVVKDPEGRVRGSRSFTSTRDARRFRDQLDAVLHAHNGDDPTAEIERVFDGLAGAADRRFLSVMVEPFVQDVRATLDPAFALSLLRDGEEWWWSTAWGITDAISGGSVPEWVFETPLHEGTFALVSRVLEWDFEHVLDPWPRCPAHGDHPLMLAVRRDEVWWKCAREDEHVARLGALPAGLN